MMTTITILSILLGTLVPALFLYLLFYGVNRAAKQGSISEAEQGRLKVRAGAILGGWVISAWVVSLSGVLAYQPGDLFPRFLITLAIPVSVGLILLRSAQFREILNHVPIHLFTGIQFFRLMGVVFLLVALSGMGPADFQNAGYGDILTGTFAVVAAWMGYSKLKGAGFMSWTFNAMGIFDLLNVSYLLLAYYPTWSNHTPSSAVASQYPLVLILTITAPVALLLHAYTTRALLAKKSSSSKNSHKEVYA